MPTTLEVIRGIAKAAANAYDGSHLESFSADGEIREVGLKREEGNPLLDERVIDGFGVKFHGSILCITYQSELKLKEVYGQNLENEMSSMIGDIAKFLKKEYKKITKNSLSLKPYEEVHVRVEHVSRVRINATAYRYFKIGGLGDTPNLLEQESEASPETGWKKFVEQGGWKGKRPPNDTRKKEKSK